MGMTKKDLSRRKANLKTTLEELEKKAKLDPIKKNKELHYEIEQIKKKLAEYD